MRNPIITAGIVCPVSIEYQTCRDILRLSEEFELAGRLVSSLNDRGIHIVTVMAGPGKIQSASATQLIIDKFEPDVIIDVGGAGSLSTDVDIFDVVCVEHAFEYNICTIEEFSRLANDLTTSSTLCDLSDEGKKVLHQFAEWIRNEKSVRFEIGNIVSGEMNVNDKTLREALQTAFQAIACNWETLAILKTARLNGVGAFAFRAITDHAGEKMSQEVKANWREALEILYSFLEEFLFGGWLVRMLVFH